MAKGRSFKKLQAWYGMRPGGQYDTSTMPDHRGHRHASPFALEFLEARVLLSGDLGVAVQMAPVAQQVDPSATVSFINPLQNAVNLQANNIASPHLPHINVAEFGRSYDENSWGGPNTPSRTEEAVKWYAERVDLTEDQNVLTHFRQYNPNIQSWKYALDLYQFQHEVGNLPESSFLHVSEPTSVTVKDTGGNVLANHTIPTGGRLEVGIWNDKVWPFNLKDADLRALNSARIVNLVGGEAGVFLDGHGVGFTDTYKSGWLTVIHSGGGIQEYGGLRPGDPKLDAEYHADMVKWLKELQSALAGAGKWGAVNQATNMGYDKGAVDQAIAINGFNTENLLTPYALRGADAVHNLYDVTQRVTANGGTAILSGQWGFQPSNYASGNYASGEGRQDMWRLAFYYLVKESPGSQGKAYFDLNLQSNSSNNIPADQRQWYPAYQFDVGQPTGEMTVAQRGTSPSDGAPYSVFTRPYSHAQVLFRPMDQWSSTEYGDRSAVTVPLEGNYRQLREDGTLGPVTNSVQIRNAEALIMLPESGAIQNVAQNNQTSTAPATPVAPLPTEPAPAPASIATPPSSTSSTPTVAEELAPSPTNDPVAGVPNAPAAGPTPAPAPSAGQSPLYPTLASSSSGEKYYTVADMLAMDWKTGRS